MTEYDFSPDAAERYRNNLRRVEGWVHHTKQSPVCNPFTPATPASDPHPLENSEPPSDDLKIHHRGLSYDKYDRHRNRDLDRQGDRDKERGVYDKHKPKARSLHHTSRPPNTRRSKSSHSTTLQSVPPPLPLPPHPWQMPYSQKPSPVPQYYPPKLTSPRESRRSSRSSSTTRLHSPNSYFPPPPSPPKYPADTNYRYTQPVREGRVPDFTVSLSSSCSQSNSHCRPQNAPQYPHSAYQVQPPPTLFKRFLRGFIGGNKQAPQRVPRRKRSSSF